MEMTINSMTINSMTLKECKIQTALGLIQKYPLLLFRGTQLNGDSIYFKVTVYWAGAPTGMNSICYDKIKDALCHQYCLKNNKYDLDTNSSIEFLSTTAYNNIKNKCSNFTWKPCTTVHHNIKNKCPNFTWKPCTTVHHNIYVCQLSIRNMYDGVLAKDLTTVAKILD